MLLDIHSHHLHEKPDTTIWSCSMKDRHSPDFSRAVWISAGIHPWFLSDNDMEAQIKWLESVLSSDRRVLAVGEAGLDKLCQTPFDVQQKAFNASIRLSEKHRLPLIIHTVRCFNELIALKKEVRPSQPWIIHGFRGKKSSPEVWSDKDFISHWEKSSIRKLSGPSRRNVCWPKPTKATKTFQHLSGRCRKHAKSLPTCSAPASASMPDISFLTAKNWLFR